MIPPQEESLRFDFKPSETGQVLILCPHKPCKKYRPLGARFQRHKSRCRHRPGHNTPKRPQDQLGPRVEGWIKSVTWTRPADTNHDASHHKQGGHDDSGVRSLSDEMERLHNLLNQAAEKSTPKAKPKNSSSKRRSRTVPSAAPHQA